MKKKVLIVGGLLFSLLIILAIVIYFKTSNTQSPQETVKLSIESLNLAVTYCRPYKKGRKIFGGLVPYNTYWRTGANESTEISISNKVMISEKLLDAGKYKLYTIPSDDHWEVVFNSELGTWGYQEPNYEKDVLRITFPVNRVDQELEQFTIELKERREGVDMVMKWDLVEVSVPIKVVK